MLGSKNMNPLKCVHLNSVTRFVLITTLILMFSQLLDCAPTTNITLSDALKDVDLNNFIQQVPPILSFDASKQNNSSPTMDNVNDTVAQSNHPRTAPSEQEIIINTKELGSFNNSIDSDTMTANNVATSSCRSIACVNFAPVITNPNSKETDFERRERRRLNDESINVNPPVNLMYSLANYKIVMDPTLKKINDSNYKMILDVSVIRKSDNVKEIDLPPMELSSDVLINKNSTKKLAEDLYPLPLPTINNIIENKNRDTSTDSDKAIDKSVPTPTVISLKTDEDPTPSPNNDLSKQLERNSSISNESSTMDTNGNIENRSQAKTSKSTNPEDAVSATKNPTTSTTSTTIDSRLNNENNQSFTPLPRIEEERRNKETPNTVEPTTTIGRIATPNPIEPTEAPALLTSQTPYVRSKSTTSSTLVSKAVESRVTQSTSSASNIHSSSIKPKMSEVELNHSKSLYDKKTDKPVKPIPETPWIPAYEVKPINPNKQDRNNMIEYRFNMVDVSQHDNDVRRNIPSNQPQPQPRPQYELQPQPQPQPRLTSQSRYGIETRINNDRQLNMVKSDSYLPTDPRVSFNNRKANVPYNKIEPYAVEEIVHFEKPIQRLNTRQYKPTPELFVRIIRHYFDNALSPAETIYTAKHNSPVVAPEQPLDQRSASSLSYRNSKP